MSALEINYTQYFTPGEWFWRLGLAGVSDNTIELFEREQIDGEAFGLIMQDPTEDWLKEQLGEDSVDFVVLRDLWEHEKYAALNLLNDALASVHGSRGRIQNTRQVLDAVTRRLLDEFDQEMPQIPVVTDSEGEDGETDHEDMD
mgnify:CR=1 FL=1